jgi:APA family basic amino acid/polyamine antiporter
MLLIGIGIIKLRWTRKDTPRPYKTLGYPITPILFILMSLFFVGVTLLEKPVQALAAIGCCLMGLPFYYYFRGRKRRGGLPTP